MRHSWEHFNRWSVCMECGARYRNGYVSTVYEFKDGSRSATAGACKGKVGQPMAGAGLPYEQLLLNIVDNGLESIQDLNTFEFIGLIEAGRQQGRSQEQVQEDLTKLRMGYESSDNEVRG